MQVLLLDACSMAARLGEGSYDAILDKVTITATIAATTAQRC